MNNLPPHIAMSLLITDPSQSIPYDINDSVTIEVKKSDN
jgi:hypothetical protein